MAFSLFKTHTNTTAAANTDVVITISEITDNPLHIKHIAWSLSATPAAAVQLIVESPASTSLFEVDITTSGPGFIDFGSEGFPGAADEDMVIKIDLAANSGCTAKLNVVEVS